MSKRNFILLIIILVIAMVVIFGFLYFRNTTTAPEADTDTNFFSRFNPFRTTTPKTPDTITDPTPTDNPDTIPEQVPEVKLVKVSTMPVAGYGIFMKERIKAPLLVEEGVGGGDNSTPPRPSGTPPQKGGEGAPKTEFVPAVRYIARETGNVYQTLLDKLEEKKFSKTIIPKVYDAYFGNNASVVVMRYLKLDEKTIQTFIGTLPLEKPDEETTGDKEITGTFLPENVRDLSLSPDTSKIFYLFETADSITGITLNFKDNKKTQVLNSAFTEWLVQWANEKMLTFTTKPASVIPGYMYSIDPAKQVLGKTFGAIAGLTTLTSPDGKKVLYGDSNLSLSLYDTTTGRSSPLSLRTMPEKCVWSSVGDAIYCAAPAQAPFGTYPEAWYQGKVSFSDQIWKLTIENGNTTLLIDPLAERGGEDIDGIKLSLDKDENSLFFVNKKDSFLWKLELK